MKNRKYFAMLALLGALTLVAAACSDDEGGETGGTGGTSATGGAVDCASDEFGCVEIAAGDPIQLASLLSITGDTAFLGTDSNNGIALAIDYLDDTFDATPGQLLGHDVDLHAGGRRVLGRGWAGRCDRARRQPGHRRRDRDLVLERRARRRRHDPG